MFAPLKTKTLPSVAKAVSATLLMLALSACSWFQFPGVYRINIQQGNIVTQDMVDQLEIGMTKRQVNFVLGTALLQDSFNLDRWDYYYSLRDAKGKLTERKFTVYFLDDALIRTEGDFELKPPTLPDSPVDDLDESFSSSQQDSGDAPEENAIAL